MTARTLLDRYDRLQAKLSKLHQDAQRALGARRLTVEDAIHVHTLARLTEAAHLMILHGSRQPGATRVR